MTREDAKREMMFAKRNVVADSWIDQAYDVAIKALSEPDLTDDDRWLIKKLRSYHNGSYARVLDKLIAMASAQPEPHNDEWCTDCKEYDHEKHCCPRFNRVIRETLKEAQPERKRGRWMLSEMYESDHVAMICSECGATYDKTVAGGPFDYCPACGADMRGKTDEAD